MPRTTPARSRVALLAAGAAFALVAGPGVGAAQAAGAVQRALCDGYTPGPCRVTTDQALVASDQLLRVSVSGNVGTEVELQFYAVEFNSVGQVTRLVPSGDPVAGSTARYGTQIVLVPRTVPDVPGGWGFIGLAEDDSIDLRTRLGQLVELSSHHLRLLGDGYAEQKPMGVELDMHVLGHVPGARYWVEYRADDGTWIPVPGQGYTAAQRLRTSPGERAHLTYSVPATLTPGRTYQFRVNSHLNFDGSSDRMVADPVFTEWQVVPSEQGEARQRDGDLDVSKGPGLPDPSASGGEGPGGGPGDDGSGSGAGPAPTSAPTSVPTSGATSAPTSVPTSGATSAPTSGATPAPRPTGAADAEPSADVDPEVDIPTSSGPSRTAGSDTTPSADVTPARPRDSERGDDPAPTAGTSASPGPSTGPSAGASAGPRTGPSAQPTPITGVTVSSGPAAAPVRGAGEAVWGGEARDVSAARAAQAAAPLRWSLAWLLGLGLAAPAGWILVRRFRPVKLQGEVW